MYVIFDTDTKTDLIMECFHNNPKDQREMMHRLDIDEQVKEWQKINSGQPPIFGSRIQIKEFTTRKINLTK